MGRLAGGLCDALVRRPEAAPARAAVRKPVVEEPRARFREHRVGMRQLAEASLGFCISGGVGVQLSRPSVVGGLQLRRLRLAACAEELVQVGEGVSAHHGPIVPRRGCCPKPIGALARSLSGSPDAARASSPSCWYWQPCRRPRSRSFRRSRRRRRFQRSPCRCRYRLRHRPSPPCRRCRRCRPRLCRRRLPSARRSAHSPSPRRAARRARAARAVKARAARARPPARHPRAQRPASGRVAIRLRQVAPVCRNAGRLLVPARSGPNRFRFTGRVSGRPLRDGTYVATTPSGAIRFAIFRGKPTRSAKRLAPSVCDAGVLVASISSALATSVPKRTAARPAANSSRGATDEPGALPQVLGTAFTEAVEAAGTLHPAFYVLLGFAMVALAAAAVPARAYPVATPARLSRGIGPLSRSRGRSACCWSSSCTGPRCSRLLRLPRRFDTWLIGPCRPNAIC